MNKEIHLYYSWMIATDIYLVSLKKGRGIKKTCKLKLENGNQMLRVKLDETREFLLKTIL